MKRGYHDTIFGFLRYNFGNVVIIRKGGRNWKAKIKEGQLDRDLNFVQWRVAIVNWKLWYKMFPSERCTHWLNFNDPKAKHVQNQKTC